MMSNQSNNKSCNKKDIMKIRLVYLSLASFYVGYVIGKAMALNGIKLC